MDTSLIDCDVQPNYVRVSLKGKVKLEKKKLRFEKNFLFFLNLFLYNAFTCKYMYYSVFQESYLNYLIFISCYSSDVPAVFNRGSQCRLQHCKEVPDHGAFAGHNAEGKLLRERERESNA